MTNIETRPDGIIGFAIGITIGILFTYIFLRRQSPTQQPQPQPNPNFMQSNPLANWKPLQSIPNIEQLYSIPKPVQAPVPVYQPVQAPVIQKYKNKQITNFIFDKDGDMIGIETTRDAIIDGK